MELATGLGLIVIVYIFEIPTHPLIEGVISIVPEIGSEVVLVAVKVEIAPVPLVANPIFEFVFVQEKTTPDGLPDTLTTGTVVPTQYDKSGKEVVIEVVL
jgi:hypothetical protein